MAMQRSIGLVGLTFFGVSGVIGSGWMFGGLYAAQIAGPAALLAWIVAAVAIAALALTFAEISALLPVAGGLARLPHFSHGNVVSAVMGWGAWLSYVTLPPIEVQAILEYASNEPHLRWLFVALPGGDNRLSLHGSLIAAALMFLLAWVNALGVAWFTRINSAITVIKLAVPIVTILALLATRFEPANFTAHGFAPDGIAGVFTAVSTGGVLLSFLGFRHIIDLAGEADDPQRTVPRAILLTIGTAIVLYLLLQTAFIGAVDPADLSQGWAKLSLGGGNGPMATLATSLGLLWLAALLYGDAVISPLGGALVAAGATGRLTMAMSQNHFFPRLFQHLTARGVPMRAIFLNTVVGLIVFVPLTGWKDVLTLHTTVGLFSFAAGPIALVALRAQLPDRHRPFRLPCATPISAAAFAISALVVYWSGWSTVWPIGLALLGGAGLLMLSSLRRPGGWSDLDLVNAWWLVPFYGGIVVVSWLGDFGGTGALPFGIDMAVLAAFSLGVFALAYRARLPDARVHAYLAEETRFEAEEYGDAPADAGARP